MSIEENLEFLTNSVTSAGALPSQVTPHGGVVIDIVGLNGERVVIQKGLPFAVTGFLSSGFTYDLTSFAGFNQDVLDFLGGGFSEIGLRLSAAIPYGSDSTYGPEFGMGLALNNVQIGNVNDHHSIASNGNGAVLGGEIIDGFLTQTHCTTWIHIDDADTLANIYNSALSTQAIDIDAIFYKPPTDTSQVSYSFATGYPPDFSTLDNTAPVPDAEVFEISEDGTLSIDVDQLLDGDTDEDGDILQVVGVKNAINGTVELNQDTGQVSFMPDANFNGIATFDYVVSDGTVNVQQTVTVNVSPVNDAPYVIANPNKPDGHENAVYLQITEDQDFYISAEDILAQFADVDGDALTIHNYLGRDNEFPYLDDFTISFFEDGGVAIELSQNLDYFSDSFGVQIFDFNNGFTPLLYVQDTSGAITPVRFYIDIIPVQDAPIAIDDQFSGKVEDGIIRGNLFQDNGFGRDYDPDTGDSFTISNLSVGALDTDIVLPSGAVLRVQANGDFTYDPTNGFTDLDVGQIENDQFNYTIVDTVGDVSTATVVFDISTGVERFVDLTASDVNIEVGYAGEFGSLSWTIKNQGTTTAVSPWLNAIYVSTDDILDASDTLVDYNSLPIDLGAGDFYLQSVLIEMPEKPGTYYYFVLANDNLALNEIDLDNNVAASGQVTVTPQYRATAFVEQDTTIAGQSFTVSGYSYTQDGAAVPYKLVTVEIDNGLGSTYRNVVTDKNGFFTFDVPSKAETGGDISVRAYFPDYAAEDTEFEDSTHLIGMDFGRVGYSIDTISGTQKQYSFEIQNLSNVDITGLDIDISGIPNDWISDISVPEVLQADGSAVVYLTLDVPSDSQNQNLNAQITLTSDIGAVTSANVTVQNHVPKAELTVDTPNLEYGMLLGDVTFVTFTVENTGGAHSGPLTLDLPDVPWITLLSATNAQGLAPGDVSKITLALAPDSTLDIAKCQGALSVNSGGANVSIPFEFNAVSNETGTLAIEVTDQFTYFDPDAPLVENASIKIVNPITQEVIYDGKDEDGSLILNDLPSGYYDISISADEHGKFQKTVKVQSGETNDVLAFIPIQLVQYKWTVTQTETDDRYVVDINTTFKTSVPAPVIVIDPPVIDLFELQNYGDELVVDFTITNHGLIATNDVNINFSDNPNYEITMPFDQLDRLDGQSSVTIPVTIKYAPEFIANDQQPTSRGIPFDNCSLTYVVNHAYSCGKEDIIASEKGSVVNLWNPLTNSFFGDCSFDSVVNASSSTSGGSGESGNSWISASSGSGYSGDCGCDPEIFTSLLETIISIHPIIGPIYGGFKSELAIANDPSAAVGVIGNHVSSKFIPGPVGKICTAITLIDLIMQCINGGDGSGGGTGPLDYWREYF